MMIELKNINVKTGDFKLQNISLQLEAEKFQVLLGPSGSGKTILLETIAGLLNPESGRVLINGMDVTDLPPEKRELSYLPQDNALFPHKNVYENIAFGLKLKNNFSPAVIDEKVSRIASILTISHLLNRSVRNLSGGEQQRVALARALVLERSILILDEPTSSLHETMQENFCLLLKDIQQKFNLTVLMTTHHKDSAFMLADTLHFIENGQLSLSVASSQLFNSPLPLRIAELLGVTNVLGMKKTTDPKVFHCTEINTNFKLSNITDNHSDEFQLGIKPVDIRVIKEEEKHLVHINSFSASVEQIFFKESDALVFLKIPETKFIIKMELAAYNLKKMQIQKGITIECKIKEEYTRILY